MKLSPTCLQSQMLSGLVFPLQVPHVWGPWLGGCSSPFFEIMVHLPFVVSLTRSFVTKGVFASVTIFDVTFFLQLGVENLFCQFAFWVNCNDMAVIYLYSWEHVNLGSSYSAIFPSSPQFCSFSIRQRHSNPGCAHEE